MDTARDPPSYQPAISTYKRVAHLTFRGWSNPQGPCAPPRPARGPRCRGKSSSSCHRFTSTWRPSSRKRAISRDATDLLPTLRRPRRPCVPQTLSHVTDHENHVSMPCFHWPDSHPELPTCLLRGCPVHRPEESSRRTDEFPQFQTASTSEVTDASSKGKISLAVPLRVEFPLRRGGYLSAHWCRRQSSRNC